MKNTEAITIIKSNWPDEKLTMLREALLLAITSLENEKPINIQLCPMCKNPRGTMVTCTVCRAHNKNL
jgi:hypothetical protein